jgi:hypothetical protein
MIRHIRLSIFAVIVSLAQAVVVRAGDAGPVVISDDGGWCWFQDERAIIHDDKLIVSTLAMGVSDKSRRGDAEVVVYDLKTGSHRWMTLFDDIGADDHNMGAFVVMPGGRILAVAATHGATNWFAARVSEPDDPLKWGPVDRVVPTEKSRITYSNLHRLSAENGRIYNFYRGLDNSFKPSFAYTDDNAATWTSGGIFIDVPAKVRHRPYVKYASNGLDTIHMVYTEGHPRDFDNSIYHIFYRAGSLHGSAGSPIAPLSKGLSKPQLGTVVYQGGVTNVAWTQDVELDGNGQPVVVFSTQRDPSTLGAGHPESGRDHRYHYARWDGSQWIEHEIAFAGSRLYPKEDDYTGLIALHPDDVTQVYFSTNVEPTTGKPLISGADGKQHYEIFHGVTSDGGKSWKFEAVTKNSTLDNIRPTVPKWGKEGKGRTAVLWLRGKLETYTQYQLQVVALIR